MFIILFIQYGSNCSSFYAVFIQIFVYKCFIVKISLFESYLKTRNISKYACNQIRQINETVYFGSKYKLLDGGMTLTIHIRKQIPCKYIESGHIPQVYIYIYKVDSQLHIKSQMTS